MTRSLVSSARSLSIPTAERNSSLTGLSTICVDTQVMLHVTSRPVHGRGDAQFPAVKAVAGTGGTLQGWATEPSGSAACITAFMIGPATLAPSELMF
jgi:hypothetical protein